MGYTQLALLILSVSHFQKFQQAAIRPTMYAVCAIAIIPGVLNKMVSLLTYGLVTKERHGPRAVRRRHGVGGGAPVQKNGRRRPK